MPSFEETLAAYRTRVGQLLDAKRTYERRAEEYGREAAIVDARIKGLLEAKELLDAERAAPAFAAEAVVTPRRRQRSLTGHWQQIMQLVDGEDGFGYAELAEAVTAVGHDANRETLRSQMSLYKGSGLIETIADGQFKMTATGRRAAGITGFSASTENEAETPASDDRDEEASDLLAPARNP